MALSATLLFYIQLTKSGAGVTGKSGSITTTIKKLTRGSTPTITTVSTGGAITVGSVTEVDATNAKGLYVVGVSGLDPAADYLSCSHYTGTASDVDLVDVPSLWPEFSPSISAGALPQVVTGAAGGVVTAGTGTAQLSTSSGQVLLQTGSGAGQLDFTSGVVKANATQFAGQTITAAAGVTMPSSVASPTNITAGTITTATNVTTVNGLAAGVITATSIAADAITDAKVASDVTIASVTGSVATVGGKTLPSNIELLSINASGHIARVTLTDTVTTYTGNTPQTGDNYARLGAPAGASVSADIAATKSDTGAVKTKTDQLTFAVANQLDANVITKTGFRLSATGVDDIWDEIQSGHTTSGTFGKFVDSQISNISGGGSGLSGPSSVTLTFTDENSAIVPLVEFTVSGQGTARSSVLGVTTFGLSNGTYTVVSRTTSGVVFANASLVVSGTTTQTIQGAAAVIATPALPSQSTGVLTTLDAQGNPQSGVAISFQLTGGPGTEGLSHKTLPFTLTSSTGGALSGSFTRLATYRGHRPNGTTAAFTVPDASSFTLPEILGGAS